MAIYLDGYFIRKTLICIIDLVTYSYARDGRDGVDETHFMKRVFKCWPAFPLRRSLSEVVVENCMHA